MPLSHDGTEMKQLVTLEHKFNNRASLRDVGVIGVDLEEGVFQVHGAAADGPVLFLKSTAVPSRSLSFPVAIEPRESSKHT
jgi:hypothetical protein